MSRSILLTIVAGLTLLQNPACAQPLSTVSIDSCYLLAKRNYPLLKQYDLIHQSAAYTINNINKNLLPQLNVAGQATYQSDVTQIPIKLPGLAIDPLSKNQYKLYGEVSQPITDLFLAKDSRAVQHANEAIQAESVNVDMSRIRDRINNLFFGIELLDAQLELTRLLIKDIQTGIDQVNAGIANGTALKSSADNLKAELLKARQRTIESAAARKGYAAMLSLFINREIDSTTRFLTPAVPSLAKTNTRPELHLYDLQVKSFDIQTKLVTAKNIPRVNLFFQGGLGRPALNMLSNTATGYYIGGLRMNWSFTGFYTSKNDKKLIAINQRSVDVQKDLFVFNTELTLRQQAAEIDKMKQLIATDDEIINLRENVVETTNSQLAFGTATPNDFLTAVNAKDQARQELALHRIQLLSAQYNYQSTSGNY